MPDRSHTNGRSMLVRLAAVAALLSALFVTTTNTVASAETPVADWAALQAALADDSVSVIRLADDISEDIMLLEIPADRPIALDLDGHDLTVHSVALAAGADLTIDDTSATEEGSLNAINTDPSPNPTSLAGIRTSDATLTVEAGTVVANGGNNRGAGIGGDGGAGSTIGGSAGTVIINGGTVHATGGQNRGAGIGSGGSGSDGNRAGGTVIINGGTVHATGGEQRGAGIGGGGGGSAGGGGGGDVTINGGTVHATGGDNLGAGIGGGGGSFGGDGGEVAINGGVVNATAGTGAGIGGGGPNGSGGEVVVAEGAEVTVSSSSSAIGSPSGGGPFGSLEVGGVLSLNSPMNVSSGTESDPAVVVTATGIIEGAGSVTAAADGAIQNNGAIRNQTVNPPSAVAVNNFLVSFVALPGDPTPDAVRVFALSFGHGARTMPDPGPGASWNSLSDATGVTVTPTTDISGLVDSGGALELFAVTPAVIGDPEPGPGTVNENYFHDLAVTGQPTPSVEVSDGTLPPGLDLNADVIEGVPTEAGTFEFTITASNPAGPAAVVPVEMTVEEGHLIPGEPVITGVAAPGETLVVDPGEGWSPEPEAFEYQWLRDGEPIEGANNADHTVGMDDTDALLAVHVTGVREHYLPASAETAPVEVPPAEATITRADRNAITDGEHLEIGDEIHAQGSGWAPGSEVTLELQSDPVTLTTTTADPDGTFALSALLEDDLPAGDHTLALHINHNEFTHTISVAVTIEEPPEQAGPGEPGPEAPPTIASVAGGPDNPPPPATAPSRDGTLPTTGTSIALLLLLATATLATGAALLGAARRRHIATSATQPR